MLYLGHDSQMVGLTQGVTRVLECRQQIECLLQVIRDEIRWFSVITHTPSGSLRRPLSQACYVGVTTEPIGIDLRHGT